mmetsp:Transcript_42382/g.99529  ORF Transcript_42382/g.99529 Transcript_42382/m.99529 type:complete len:106 (+) Transcript_42382:685-1002(+)
MRATRPPLTAIHCEATSISTRTRSLESLRIAAAYRMRTINGSLKHALLSEVQCILQSLCQTTASMRCKGFRMFHLIIASQSKLGTRALAGSADISLVRRAACQAE